MPIQALALLTRPPGLSSFQGQPVNQDYDERFRCAVCRVWYVVPTLARDCEDTHRGDSRETPDAGPQD